MQPARHQQMVPHALHFSLHNLPEMCQSQARHTKARFETTIVGAMEQLGGYRAKSLSCPPILGPPKDIMTQLTQVGPTDPVNAPDYTGQLRYAKNWHFPYLGRTTLQVRAGGPVGRR